MQDNAQPHVARVFSSEIWPAGRNLYQGSSQGTVGYDAQVCATLQGYASPDYHCLGLGGILTDLNSGLYVSVRAGWYDLKFISRYKLNPFTVLVYITVFKCKNDNKSVSEWVLKSLSKAKLILKNNNKSKDIM